MQILGKTSIAPVVLGSACICFLQNKCDCEEKNNNSMKYCLRANTLPDMLWHLYFAQISIQWYHTSAFRVLGYPKIQIGNVMVKDLWSQFISKRTFCLNTELHLAGSGHSSGKVCWCYYSCTLTRIWLHRPQPIKTKRTHWPDPINSAITPAIEVEIIASVKGESLISEHLAVRFHI